MPVHDIKSDTWKLPALMLVVFLGLVAVLDGMLWDLTFRSEQDYMERESRLALDRHRHLFSESFREVRGDLGFVVEEVTISGLLESDNWNTRAEVSRVFLSYSRSRGVYDQIRYLDRQGLEVVRVDYNAGRPGVVPDSFLENKKSRYWFQEVTGLERNQVYVSPLDLKIEGDRPVWPYRPTIRFGMPVHTLDGRPNGLVVLNYLAAPLLERFRGVHPEGSQMLLLAEGGEYLVGPQAEWEWGSILPERRDFSLAKMDPEAWKTVQATDAGRVRTDRGTYYFDTFRPFGYLGWGYEGVAGVVDPSVSEPGSHRLFWKAVVFVPEGQHSTGYTAVLFQMLALNVVVVLVLIGAVGLYIWWNQGRRAMLDQLRRLSQAVDQSPATVVITDPTGRIIYANQRFAETTGYTLQEALGQNPRILKSGRQPPELYAQLWETISQGGVWRGELQNKRKNDELYWEFATISPIRSPDGRITHFLAIKEDISERKRAEVELRKAIEAAEGANRAKSAFLANMSHEIRTPMNGILGMTDLVLMMDLDPLAREYLTTARKSAVELLALLGGILDLSKIEAGRFELEARPFRLRDVVAEVLRSFAVDVQTKGLCFYARIDPLLPDGLVGDPSRVRQILTNLVGNAVKFTRRGEIVVQARLRYLEPERVKLLFEIRDTGIGVPPEKQKEIFSPFTQGDGSTTREFGGTGLGLSIAGQLVELMGGRIWVESQAGRGSSFFFTLTLARDLESNVQGPEEISVLTGHTILVVQDHTEERAITREILVEAGASVEDWDGRSALEFLESPAGSAACFDLVILDVSGADVNARLNRLIASPQVARRPPLYLTPSIGGMDALPTGNRLTKPVLGPELAAAVRRAIFGGGACTPEPFPVAPDAPACLVKGLRVLVTEDDPVNRKVAQRLLEKKGFLVQVVENGARALEALAGQSFDLVLMDVRMPDMDGLEATRRIRERETRLGLGRIPVVALTAMSLKGDREEGLAAGMDAYLTKPIEVGQLDRVLIEVFSRFNPEACPPHPETPILIPQELLERVDGDRVLLKDLAGLFFQELPAKEEALNRAVENRDGPGLEWAAKSLAAALGQFAARAAIEAARGLERLGEKNDFQAVEQVRSRLAKELVRFKDTLDRLIQGGN
jgi:PAS domain S-box-containing protein